MVWFGLFGGGVVRCERGEWSLFNTSNSSLPDDFVWSLAVDHQHHLWIGTFHGRLLKFDGHHWFKYDEEATGFLINSPIWDILVDRDNKVWFATSQGLMLCQPEPTVQVPTPPFASSRADVSVFQNYPNPFNSHTTFAFQLTWTSPVEIMIYNLAGRAVRILDRSIYLADCHHLSWNGLDDRGQPLPSGLYFYSVATSMGTTSRPLLLLR